jgi:uncharacterized protein YneF (UPF0154 family)
LRREKAKFLQTFRSPCEKKKTESVEEEKEKKIETTETMGQSSSTNQRDDWEIGLPDDARERLASSRRHRKSRSLAMRPSQLGCCASCCRKVMSFMSVIVYSINFLFLALGLLLVGAGAWAYVQLGEVADLVHIPLSIGLIVLGAVVTVLSLFGCCGAYFKKKTLLKVYLALLLVVILAQVGVGLGLYFSRSQLIDDMDDTWQSADDELRSLIQKKFDCCGWDTVDDKPANTDQCLPNHGDEGDDADDHDGNGDNDHNNHNDGNDDNDHNDGDSDSNEPETSTEHRDDENNDDENNKSEVKACKDQVVDFVDDRLAVLEISAAVIVSIQFVALILSACLILCLKPEDELDELAGYERVRMLDDF